MNKYFRVGLILVLVFLIPFSFGAGYYTKSRMSSKSAVNESKNVNTKKTLEGYTPAKVQDLRYVVLKEGEQDGKVISATSQIEIVLRVVDAGTGVIIDDTHSSTTTSLKVSVNNLPNQIVESLIGQKQGVSMRILVPVTGVSQVKGLISSDYEFSEGAVLDIRVFTVI